MLIALAAQHRHACAERERRQTPAIASLDPVGGCWRGLEAPRHGPVGRRDGRAEWAVPRHGRGLGRGVDVEPRVLVGVPLLDPSYQRAALACQNEAMRRMWQCHSPWVRQRVLLVWHGRGLGGWRVGNDAGHGGADVFANPARHSRYIVLRPGRESEEHAPVSETRRRRRHGRATLFRHPALHPLRIAAL
jgi:hypothetical protein